MKHLTFYLFIVFNWSSNQACYRLAFHYAAVARDWRRLWGALGRIDVSIVHVMRSFNELSVLKFISLSSKGMLAGQRELNQSEWIE